MTAFKIALAQYPIDFFDDFSTYETKLEKWVSEAVAQNAALLVFPEYGSMELTSLLSENVRNDLHASVDALMDFWDNYERLHQKLAQQYNVHILASSFPKNRKNIAALYGPSGKIGEQGKCIMTRFEREEWNIEASNGAHVFETELGKIGIAICYDSEFPLLVRTLAEKGAELILAPSCTDTVAGYMRVRIGCQARALENQCYVAQSSVVGEALWSPATDINIGAAGLFGPPDVGFPETGIIAEGTLNEPGWVYGDVHLSKVGSVRRHGRVLNYKHWDEQKAVKAQPDQ
ncbi:MAG: carbon-nitrogen hydrolase family protein [Alphaproteobacteria bacterium]|nr:carbon-nitrogen hydrolase family protein [Alphaproteobacteria bacterium]